MFTEKYKPIETWNYALAIFKEEFASKKIELWLVILACLSVVHFSAQHSYLNILKLSNLQAVSHEKEYCMLLRICFIKSY